MNFNLTNSFGMGIPPFWDEIANLIGKELAEIIYSYFQYLQIGIFIVAVVTAIFTLGMQSIRVWACDNEDAKKQLKFTRIKFIHMFVYIGISLVFIQIFWNFILPPIWEWASNIWH